MNSELTLKFKSETGTSTTGRSVRTNEGYIIDIPTDEYLEFLEELALRQIKMSKEVFEAQKALKKIGDIKLNFESLKSEISNLFPGEIDECEIDSITDQLDDLE